jgi:hypothetical protein
VCDVFEREVSLVSAMLLDVPVSPVKRSPSTFGKAVYARRLQHCGPGGQLPSVHAQCALVAQVVDNAVS